MWYSKTKLLRTDETKKRITITIHLYKGAFLGFNDIGNFLSLIGL